MRVSAYLRATPGERPDVEAQRDELAQWAQAVGHVVIGWHADEGDVAKVRLSLRPGLAGVISDLVARRSAAVAVTTPESLDDDIVVQEVLAREFTRLGGVLLTAAGSQAGRRDRERIRRELDRAEIARHELVR